MKWDSEADPDDLDEDDNAEFEKLRRVCTLLIIIIFTDKELGAT